jgi:hypothetical protein
VSIIWEDEDDPRVARLMQAKEQLIEAIQDAEEAWAESERFLVAKVEVPLPDGAWLQWKKRSGGRCFVIRVGDEYCRLTESTVGYMVAASNALEDLQNEVQEASERRIHEIKRATVRFDAFSSSFDEDDGEE